jgi:hypothetical protein
LGRSFVAAQQGSATWFIVKANTKTVVHIFWLRSHRPRKYQTDTKCIIRFAYY